MFVLVAVWTSFLTKSIKDSNVVFLLGFGIHELFFLNLGRGMSLSSERDDIVIKSADKGSAIVLMDKVDYLEEANRQLTDERFYQKLDSDPTEEFSTKITQELTIMKENSHIDKNTFDYLKPDKPKVGRFYLLPKIHKVNNPGRPIV
jgi:hypothetical protein